MARALIKGDKLYWQYGQFRIMPGYMGFDWVHTEYDGPEDNRCGNEATVELCVEQIEEWYADQNTVAHILYYQNWHSEYCKAAMFHRTIGELSRATKYQNQAAECFRIIEIWRD